VKPCERNKESVSEGDTVFTKLQVIVPADYGILLKPRETQRHMTS